MAKDTGKFLGILVVAVVIIGGLIYFGGNHSTTTTQSTTSISGTFQNHQNISSFSPQPTIELLISANWSEITSVQPGGASQLSTYIIKLNGVSCTQRFFGNGCFFNIIAPYYNSQGQYYQPNNVGYATIYINGTNYGNYSYNRGGKLQYNFVANNRYNIVACPSNTTIGSPSCTQALTINT